MKKRLLSLALAFIMCLSLLPATAFAASQEEKLAYTHTIVDGGEDYMCVTGVIAPIKGVLRIPAEIDGIPMRVIGQGVFSGQKDMTGIEMPESIDKIETKAFENCTGLQKVELPPHLRELGDTVFTGCTSLTQISLQPGIEECGEHCWEGTPWYDNFPDGISYQDGYLICAKGDALGDVTVAEGTRTILPHVMKNKTSLTSLTLPQSLQMIGEEAFRGCTNLTTVQGMEYPAAMGDAVFSDSGLQGEIRLSPDMKEVPSEAFQNCAGLTGVQLPAGLKSIGYATFFNCEKLSGVVLPQGLEYIGAKAFYCDDLKSITIPASVMTVAKNAFANNLDLAEVHAEGIPKTLGQDVFEYTKWMENQEGGPAYLGSWLVGFNGWMPGNYTLEIRPGTKVMAEECMSRASNLVAATIPASLSRVPYYAFKGCPNLRSVTMEPGVECIGESALRECPVLTEVSIPDTVTEIDKLAFYMSRGLKEIRLPENLKVVRYATFEGCTSLEKVTFGDKLEVLDPYSFESCISLRALDFGPRLSRIGWNSFDNCTSLKTVHFAGSAPRMEDYCFDGVQAEAYYNATDPTWDTALVSNWASAQFTWVPEAPEGALPASELKAAMGSSGVDLNWNSVSGADHYEIWACCDAELPYTKIGESRTTSFTHTKALPGSEYRYRIRAMAADGQPGICSNIQKIAVKMMAPVVTGSVDPVTGIPSLQWNDVPGASEYHIIIRNNTLWEYVEDKRIQGTTYVHKTAIPGTSYTYWIYAVNESGGEGPDGGLTLQTPLPKTSLRVKLNSTGQPVVSWDEVEFAYGYEVCAQRAGGDLVLLQTQDTTLTHWATQKGTYSYQVRALTEDGEGNGPWSDPESIQVTRTEGPAPEVKVSYKESTGKPVLNWTEVPGAAEYEVERKAGADGTFAPLYTARGTSLTNGSAKPGMVYAYRVRALAEDGTAGAWSSTVTATCQLARPDVTVSARSDGKPVLTWDKIDGAVKYEVYYSADGGDFERLTSVNGTKLNHTSAKPGHTYAYQVRSLAEDQDANSTWSEAVTFTVTEQSLTAPALTATNKRTTGKPYLKWDKVDGAEKYEVYRATSKNGEFTRLWSGSGTALTNGSAKAGTTYYYKVRAVAADGGKSLFSAVKYRTCDCARPVLTVSYRADGKPILRWHKVDGAVKYQVYRSVDGGKYQKFYVASGTKLTNGSAKSGHTYAYKVRAICANSYGSSALSAAVTAKVK